MKKIIYLIAIMATSYVSTAQSVGINTDGSTADSSAILDLKSTSQGFLPPRLTQVQIDAINNPADGLVVYNTTTKCLNFYSGSFWNASCGSPVTVPDSPIITGVISGNEKAIIAFTAPANDGGSPIITYTAISSPGGFTGTVSQPGNGSIVVNGLSGGIEYTFTITATNSVGTSTASAVSVSVIPSESITYSILDQYANYVPTGTTYAAYPSTHNQYIDAGSIDNSPFVINRLTTTYYGGIVFYNSTELTSKSDENTFRLSSTSGNFNFISFYLQNLEELATSNSSTIPKITLTSSSGSTISFQAEVTTDTSFGDYFEFNYPGVKTLNWNNIEWVDIKTKYVKAKTKNYVLKAL